MGDCRIVQQSGDILLPSSLYYVIFHRPTVCWEMKYLISCACSCARKHVLINIYGSHPLTVHPQIDSSSVIK